MDTCGLTAEYNPFHRGHQKQLRLIREKLGEKTGLVVCISGPFCQRGVPTLLDKGVRAELALRLGADLVLELPVAFATASAERFARGAVETLLATGVVRRIAYGTEAPEDRDKIKQAAAILADEPPELGLAIREGIASGKGFAQARQDALAKVTQDPGLARLLAESNTILAVEYEKALLNSSPLPTLALPLFDKASFSASLIRDRVWKTLTKGPDDFLSLTKDLSSVLPPPSVAAIMGAVSRGRGILHEEMTALPFLLTPAFFDRDRLNQIAGMQAGLSGRLFKALRQDPASALQGGERPYNRFIDSLATRAFPASRIRRAILSAALGIPAEDLALTQDGPGYIRVLAFNRRGRRLLSYMRKEAHLPLILNASDFRQLEEESARRQAALDFQAQAVWNHLAGLDTASEFERQVLQVR
jgi:predicted nucleotidyltransferase